MRTLVSIFLILAAHASVAAAADLASLPRLDAARTTSVALPQTGVRGIQVSGGQLRLLATQNTSLGAPEETYRASILIVDANSGDSRTLSTEIDSYESGLAMAGGFLWSGGSLLGTREGLYQIRPSDGQVVNTLPGSGVHPGGLAYDGDYMWQVDANARKMFRIDLEDGKISRKVPTPAFYPTGLAFDGRSFWCADASTGRLYRMKAGNGEADGVVRQEAFYYPGEFVSVAFDGGALWVVSASEATAHRIEILR